MATALMPHAFSHVAIAWRSAVLPPNWRTGSASRSAGTQTMCISEWTSMPAASGLTTWSGAVEAGTGRRTERSAARADGFGSFGFLGFFGFLGSSGTSWGTTMDLSGWGGHRSVTTRRRAPRGVAGTLRVSPTGSIPWRVAPPWQVTNDKVEPPRARLRCGQDAPEEKRPLTRDAGDQGRGAPRSEPEGNEQQFTGRQGAAAGGSTASLARQACR